MWITVHVIANHQQRQAYLELLGMVETLVRLMILQKQIWLCLLVQILLRPIQSLRLVLNVHINYLAKNYMYLTYVKTKWVNGQIVSINRTQEQTLYGYQQSQNILLIKVGKSVSLSTNG